MMTGLSLGLRHSAAYEQYTLVKLNCVVGVVGKGESRFLRKGSWSGLSRRG
ncbi:hypothetical protein E2C01_091845 [Portunus trituberculatus]|uniref:Uncharacterized protein n=1 Tax=Portunus trituberculatus TaxID=210409 RepID=A0A5B7JP27_PORTR|nr:hypothetical protein [Portunus trituberculatus]